MERAPDERSADGPSGVASSAATISWSKARRGSLDAAAKAFHGLGSAVIPHACGIRMLYVYLAIGGMVGTLARFGLSGWIQASAGPTFPWGTLVVNLVGSFALGLGVRGAELTGLSPELRAMVTIGFCGAFTTFSTFSFESFELLRDGAWGRALVYALSSVGMGTLALAFGLTAAGFLFRAMD